MTDTAADMITVLGALGSLACIVLAFYLLVASSDDETHE